MRILVLAWEFPPRIVGGIARHVAELYPELADLGHDIHLITIEFGDAPSHEVVEGVYVHRVAVEPGRDFFDWIGNMNKSMEAYARNLLTQMPGFDLIHAHDWLVADSAIILKHTFKIPLIGTVHATEFGRYNGLYTDTHYYIHHKEFQLTYNAWRLIVCTNHMKRELQLVFQTPADKIDVIYNGIRPEKKRWDPRFDYQTFRRHFAADQEKIVYYLGRMSYEKGVSVLLEAAPKVLEKIDGKVKFIIIGGGDTGYLKQQAEALGIWHKCFFTGFMSEADLDKFQVIADCAVFPSLYEPFGIVVLESFAARVPVVVSDTCGLPEVVRHQETGIVTRTNDPDSLAAGILEVINNPMEAERLIDQAYNDLHERFNWLKLAQKTEMVYRRVLQERSQVIWE